MRVLGLLVLAGCGGACPQAQADHRALFEAVQADDQVDGVVEVPFALIDGLLAAELARVGAVPLAVPGLGGLSVAPTAARLRPGPPGQIAFTVALAVRRGGRELFSLESDAQVAPRIDSQGLVFAIGPESLRKVAPRLGPEAGNAVAGLIRAELPAPVRLALTPARLRSLTDRALAAIVDGAYALLRDGSAARFLPRTEVALALPHLPLRRIEVRSHDRWLEVGLHADVRSAGSGLAAVGAPPPGRVRVRLTGDAVAGLGNHAIAAGALPGRYSEKGEADPRGPLSVGLGWVAEPRPLKALVWRTEGTCVHARLGGTPELAVESARPALPDGKPRDAANPARTLALRLRDGTVEVVEGSWYVEAGAWLTGVWDRTFQWTHRAVAEVGLTVAGRPLKLALSQAKAGPQGIDFTMEIER